ncbi:hypothetical protein NOSIN_11540 [Nocardiopsis sinuspersici]|uniref:Uncharacterized protein n=1 Tax=Nocardiopsis sinuspersici TaxID=501010 RepID=A0A1V3C1M4_9ACTN|nr:hypothetical protein NOSIN_11540 [Nocardiopsis sinuspersici]
MSEIEYGAKVLDADAGQVARLILDKSGAEVGEVLQRRYVYDIEPGDASRWVRPRDTGNQVQGEFPAQPTSTPQTDSTVPFPGIPGKDAVLFACQEQSGSGGAVPVTPWHTR